MSINFESAHFLSNYSNALNAKLVGPKNVVGFFFNLWNLDEKDPSDTFKRATYITVKYDQDILCCLNLHHMTLFFQLEIKINSVFCFSVRNVNRSTSLPRKQQERNNDNDSQVS